MKIQNRKQQNYIQRSPLFVTLILLFHNHQCFFCMWAHLKSHLSGPKHRDQPIVKLGTLPNVLNFNIDCTLVLGGAKGAKIHESTYIVGERLAHVRKRTCTRAEWVLWYGIEAGVLFVYYICTCQYIHLQWVENLRSFVLPLRVMERTKKLRNLFGLVS